MKINWPAETPNFWNNIATIARDNPPTEHFKTDYIVYRVPLYTDYFLPFDREYLKDVMSYYDRQSESCKEVISKALQERRIGHTNQSYTDAIFSPSKDLQNISVWTVKSLHHWITLLELSGKDINEYDHIVEVGAGIGESARMVYDALCYRGEYTILDLPEISEYSKINLKDYPQVKFAMDVKNINASSKTLLFSTWGLSEIQLRDRDIIVKQFKDSDMLVAFQGIIFDVDNKDYFVRKYPTLYKKNIKLKNISMLNADEGNFYMFATR